MATRKKKQVTTPEKDAAFVPQKAEEYSEDHLRMLAWLPKLGEWYEVTDRARLKYYFSRNRDSKQHNDYDHIFSGTKIFITNITLPNDSEDFAVLDFIVGNDPQRTKTYYLPIYPPKSTFVSFWKILLRPMTSEE